MKRPHALLEGLTPPAYPGMLAVWAELIPALLRQKREPGFPMEKPLPDEKTAAMREPVRLGMVGGGPGAMIGATHRIAARMYGRYRLVAGVFSRTPERNRAMGEELALRPDRVYADYREMARVESAREDGIEAVAVVTPNDSHVPISVCFLRHGIHVLCDKPLANSLADAEALRDVVEERRVRIRPDPQLRGLSDGARGAGAGAGR